jgi:hypothetical protein
MAFVFIYIVFFICVFILLGVIIIGDIRMLKKMNEDIYITTKESKKIIKELTKKFKDKNLN